ncbi:hypothetical protein DXT97_08655 [Agrobacterium tumefaciens]|uniref:hypothetical protein n=1 Tax=Agrobacterium tumefaciens TaxID=358 RepID=UPI00129583D6|nr:hypothetical protein [Agrobacterium tumefaciens]MQB36868.1 hypothetical protein [Agrobacterium tumefaciens]
MSKVTINGGNISGAVIGIQLVGDHELSMTDTTMIGNGIAISVSGQAVPHDIASMIQAAVTEAKSSGDEFDDVVEKVSRLDRVRTFLSQNGLGLAELTVSVAALWQQTM